MMTWHTRFSFARGAQDLENEHLRAQIDDAKTVMEMILAKETKPSTPVFYMWNHWLPALIVMGMMYSMEWTFHRGYEDKTFWAFKRTHDELKKSGEAGYMPPPWFRDEAVVMSHRSALISRYGEAYAEQWPSAPKAMPVLWPDPPRGDARNIAFVKPGASVPPAANLRVAKGDLPHLRSKTLVVPSKYQERVVNL